MAVAASAAMMPFLALLVVGWAAAAVSRAADGPLESVCARDGPGSVHEFTLHRVSDPSQPVHLSSYRGKVLLLVNVATY